MDRSVTTHGNRVTVYWDQRLVGKGEQCDRGIVAGLLHSLSFIPLLSYNAIVPLADVPHNNISESGLGWAVEPLGSRRLKGTESDPEDGMLKVG